MKEIILLRRKRRNRARDFLVALGMVAATFMLTATVLNMFNREAEAEAFPVKIGSQKSETFLMGGSVVTNPIIPAKIEIPIISVNAKIVPVGITTKGAMMSPKSFKEVGWYKYGAQPGEVGNAYIVGHLDNAFGLSGVFKDVQRLVEGDTIYILDEGGERLHFKVTERKAVSHESRSLSGIVGDTHLPRMVIITCQGTWLPEEKTYSERLVIIAELQN